MTPSRPKSDFSPDRLFAQSVAHQQSGRLAEAEAGYRTLLKHFPEQFDVVHNLGRLLLASNRPQEALVLWSRMAAYQPRDPRPPLEEAMIHIAQGQHSLAEGALQTVAKLATNDATWRRIAGAYVAMRRYDLAVDAFQHALELGPADPANYSGFASLCNELGDYSFAADIARTAIQLSPESGTGWLELGNALMHQGEGLAAAEVFVQLANLCPSSPDPYCNLGLIHQEIMQLDEAITHFDTAITLDPVHEMARWNRSLALLTQGKLAAGWSDYELRRGTAVLGIRTSPPCPEWQGEILTGKTILLIHEQGLGDSLQFIRYASLLQNLGARVWVWVPASLVRLFQRAEGVDAVFSDKSGFPEGADYYSLMLSLPLRFMTTLESIPGQIPYLSPDPAEVEVWRQRLSTLPAPRVGVVWAGGERLHHAASVRLNQRRNLPLSLLAPVLNIENVSFVSLQKGDAEREIADGNFCRRINDFSPLLDDMATTAALTANLDLVIGVDTSVIHLAGALGKPVWMLNRFDTDWRWMAKGNGSLWYPSLRQFRQPTAGDWATPILELSIALANYP